MNANTGSHQLTHQERHHVADKPLLGISDCLLGSEVRFNGGHKRSRYCTDVLGGYFEFQAFCPEVASGMSTPRPAIRMVNRDDQLEVIASDQPSKNYLPDLLEASHAYLSRLQGLSGYILMQKSPSCGYGSSKIYNAKGMPEYSENGVFAQALVEHFPHLPLIEAGQLNDPGLRENFIFRVYAFHEWQTQVAGQLTTSAIQTFHHRYKLLLAAHNEKTAKALGKRLAKLTQASLEEVADHYISEFMKATVKPVERLQQANLLQKIHRFIKDAMTADERSEINLQIQRYRQGVIPLIVPMTMIRHFFTKYKGDSTMTALHAYPDALGLQNSI